MALTLTARLAPAARAAPLRLRVGPNRLRRYSVVLWVGLLPSGLAGAVDFRREVQPILSDKCFHCHGPDEKAREAKLRLDTPEGALRLRDGAAVIVPGNGAGSELILRVTSPHADEAMPPPESKLARLTPAEIDVLKRWIDAGARYEAHWAFVPLAATSAERSIDQIVSAHLARQGLALQPEAEAETLLRRLAFDLTGLPPAPADVAPFKREFLGSPENAIRNLTDRLLASPRYGERMAADWLDLARYADSYGFQRDTVRPMWPWRDWVIDAFNRNLPWSTFVTWQLAGDLLPGATDEQILATAFNRLHAQESEAGSVEEEYRVHYVNDRVTTFGTAFLGLTLECTRCHDHKFDPISQTEFYSLAAFFQNIDEAGLYALGPESVPTPTLWLPDAAHQKKYAAATATVAQAEADVATARAARRDAFTAWLAQPAASVPAIDGELARFDFDRSEPRPFPTKLLPVAKAVAAAPDAPDADVAAKPADLAGFANAVDPSDYAVSSRDNEFVPGRAGLAIRIRGDLPVVTTHGDFQRHDAFSVSLWLRTPEVKERAVVFHRSSAASDAGSRGYELLIEEGRLKWSLIHFWPGNAISIRATEPLPLDTWVHVTVTNDGSSRAAGLRLFLDGRPARLEIVRDLLTKDITGRRGNSDPPGYSSLTITLGARYRDRAFKDGLIDDVRIFGRALGELEAAELFAPGALAAAAPAEKFEFYLANHDDVFRTRLAALAAARAAQTQLADAAREIMVMRELPQPKPAYVLERGQYDRRGETVQAGTPAALPAFPADQPRNRLGLARWLTDPRHPLFARVTVNRFWQALFGWGLVKTADDFGLQGERPEYPELLDWLAAEFIRTGWDVKGLLKTIVLSQTYRQRSFAAPPLMTDDPENIRLARGPRHRLPAEMIRDQALAASGLLVEKIGGPPVFTYDMPESFKPAAAGKGADLHRRSLYTFWRRTGPAPLLEAFDVPKRVVCIARRDTTNTPLQSLVLLNGPQFVEAARVLAEKLHRAHAGRPDDLVADAFLRLASRSPDATERAILARLYAEQLAEFRADPAAAAAHLAIGRTPRDTSLPAPEVAAAAVLVNTLMNHDAFVVKR